MKENSLTFIPKWQNPPSAPQFRPIEAFWWILKQKFFGGNLSANDRPQLNCRIKICASEIVPDVITKMVQNLKAKIHEANKKELTSLLWYVTYPISMDYEISLTIMVSNSLKLELVHFFFGPDSGALVRHVVLWSVPLRSTPWLG